MSGSESDDCDQAKDASARRHEIEQSAHRSVPLNAPKIQSQRAHMVGSLPERQNNDSQENQAANQIW